MKAVFIISSLLFIAVYFSKSSHSPQLQLRNESGNAMEHELACDAQTFSGVSSDVWRCFTDAVSLQEGFRFSGGNTGRVSAKGAVVDYSVDQTARTAIITVVDTPFLISCSRMNTRMSEFMQDCYGPSVRRIGGDRNREQWRIDGPNVKRPETRYHQVTLRRKDRVRIDAGGCVQTGGRGDTWKLFVDPRGPGSNNLYHGLIRLPGMSSSMRIREFVTRGNNYEVPENASGDMSLYIGFEDNPNDYANNGYWGHDNGIDNQCRNVGKAWIEITIFHP